MRSGCDLVPFVSRTIRNILVLLVIRDKNDVCYKYLSRRISMRNFLRCYFEFFLKCIRGLSLLEFVVHWSILYVNLLQVSFVLGFIPLLAAWAYSELLEYRKNAATLKRWAIFSVRDTLDASPLPVVSFLHTRLLTRAMHVLRRIINILIKKYLNEIKMLNT